MSPDPFSGHGPRGEAPQQPGARNGHGTADDFDPEAHLARVIAGAEAGWLELPEAAPHRDADDFDLEAHLARVIAEAEVGRVELPEAAPHRDADDFDLEAHLARVIAGAEAGRVPFPEAAGGLSVIAAGPDELAALGVDGLAGLDVAGFAQGGTADTMPPGTLLTALAQAACAAGTLEGLSDNQVLGLAGAARRLTALGSWLQTAAIAEFAGRRATGDTPGQVAGQVIAEFASHELAPELVITDHAADELMRQAVQVTRRLPGCLAALRAGHVTGFQVKIAAEATVCLSDGDAAEAGRLIAAAAPSLTPGQLRAMCARTALMIDPGAARRRKDEAAKDARVERFQEHSGTAALCGRDLPTDEVLAASTHIDAVARQLRAAGMRGTLRALRVRVYLDLTQGKDPHARLTGPIQDTPVGGTADPGQAAPDDHEAWNDANYGKDGDGEDGEGSGGTGPRPAGPASPAGPGGSAAFPALINLLVPAGTLLGWSSAPGEAAGWGLLDAQTTSDLTQAASAHPRTRWCVTVVGADGTAQAHGCAAGRHPYDPATYATGGGNRDGPATARDGQAAPEAAGQVTQLLRQLNVTLAPIAKGACDHRHHEDRYEVSRKLKHLIKARTARCIAPGCNRHAAESDADHTIPWPEGPSCECNLGPPCRRHHRCKQAPGWTLEQASPGVMTWTNPAGRKHTTLPTRYHI
jgi:Domain of unknown function (DUF222)